MGLFVDCHKKGIFKKSLNATFISLPEVTGAKDINNRPISLVGSAYKILAKALASRLRIVIGKVIGPYQHAFITSRPILNAPLIATECIDSCLKSNLPKVICKLHIKKAYDHVSWDFLMAILERMGFPKKWSWVYFCVSTVHFSVLVKGKATGFFPSTRGLRQGDPLSPSLFILVMESLSRLIIKTTEVGFQEDFSEDIRISHLLFANSTLIFRNSEVNHLGYLRCILVLF